MEVFVKVKVDDYVVEAFVDSYNGILEQQLDEGEIDVGQFEALHLTVQKVKEEGEGYLANQLTEFLSDYMSDQIADLISDAVGKEDLTQELSLSGGNYDRPETNAGCKA